MLLDLDNENKVKRFYKLLWFYKSFIFYGTKFESNSTDKNIKLIIDGLNIKERKERIRFVYDLSCDMIDDYYNHEDTCGFMDGKCYSHRCLKKDYYNGCCRRCRYQSNSGCTSRNLACKLFMCSEVTSRREVIKYKDIKLLKLLSLKNRYVVKSDYFSLREDVLKDLYTYTLTYAGIRVVYRIIRDQIYVSRKKGMNNDKK